MVNDAKSKFHPSFQKKKKKKKKKRGDMKQKQKRDNSKIVSSPKTTPLPLFFDEKNRGFFFPRPEKNEISFLKSNSSVNRADARSIVPG